MSNRHGLRFLGVLALMLAVMLGTGCSDGSDGGGPAASDTMTMVKALGEEVGHDLQALRTEHESKHGTLQSATTVESIDGITAQLVKDVVMESSNESGIESRDGAIIRMELPASAAPRIVEIGGDRARVDAYDAQMVVLEEPGASRAEMAFRFRIFAEEGSPADHDGAHEVVMSYTGDMHDPKFRFDVVVDGKSMESWSSKELSELLGTVEAEGLPKNDPSRAVIAIALAVASESTGLKSTESTFHKSVFTNYALKNGVRIDTGTLVIRHVDGMEESVFLFTIGPYHYLWEYDGNNVVLYRDGKRVRP